ncbi:hypothetical protein M4I21_04505 [Cellulophaga sp. 20_2_10]|uniref:hypothetical protein n=1 Tax=Cellulophaga sp. 20_2_10 TaxID=2942476 RepID=UPI00201A779E|nr:hypothetical protein [Cellulophaga sp. 20_2_10]MCL5245056.1 hypothetical protein [Cellulophaga sp. 20_2_10]
MKEILNQLYEIEQKSIKNEITLFDRNLKRLFHEIEEQGFFIKNPIGEKFTELRTDIDATLINNLGPNSKITKVLKPIIYKKDGDQLIIIQKGVAIVE